MIEIVKSFQPSNGLYVGYLLGMIFVTFLVFGKNRRLFEDIPVLIFLSDLFPLTSSGLIKLWLYNLFIFAITLFLRLL